jgi:hypothetical protein
MITSTVRPEPAEATGATGLDAPLALPEAAAAAGREPALGPDTTSQTSATESSAMAESVAAFSTGRRALRLDGKRGTAAPGIAATHTKRRVQP